ncbi:MAG: hypothetical protein CL676_01390 [Bdellovibrionaceae bacterium]|nr:hypothetical protein [Pseudobdellovibrionaceae bacterium]
MLKGLITQTRPDFLRSPFANQSQFSIQIPFYQTRPSLDSPAFALWAKRILLAGGLLERNLNGELRLL